MEIDHTNCDPIMVRDTLIKFVVDITDIIREEIGEDLSLKYYREGKIYNYIFSNLKKLKSLNLDMLFIKLFLIIEF